MAADIVKSVNGKTLDVVLTSEDIKASSSGTKTIEEVVKNAYVGKVDLIENTTNDYVLTITKNKGNVIHPDFELGDIYVKNSSALGYTATNTMMRTPEGTTFALYSDSKFSIDQDHQYTFKVYRKVTGGSWELARSWSKNDYHATENGEYAVVVKDNPEVDLSAVTNLSELFTITY